MKKTKKICSWGEITFCAVKPVKKYKWIILFMFWFKPKTTEGFIPHCSSLLLKCQWMGRKDSTASQLGWSLIHRSCHGESTFASSSLPLSFFLSLLCFFSSLLCIFNCEKFPFRSNVSWIEEPRCLCHLWSELKSILCPLHPTPLFFLYKNKTLHSWIIELLLSRKLDWIFNHLCHSSAADRLRGTIFDSINTGTKTLNTISALLFSNKC